MSSNAYCSDWEKAAYGPSAPCRHLRLSGSIYLRCCIELCHQLHQTGGTMRVTPPADTCFYDPRNSKPLPCPVLLLLIIRCKKNACGSAPLVIAVLTTCSTRREGGLQCFTRWHSSSSATINQFQFARLILHVQFNDVLLDVCKFRVPTWTRNYHTPLPS